eukprot:sb/3477763/
MREHGEHQPYSDNSRATTQYGKLQCRHYRPVDPQPCGRSGERTSRSCSEGRNHPGSGEPGGTPRPPFPRPTPAPDDSRTHTTVLQNPDPRNLNLVLVFSIYMSFSL